MKKWLIDNFLPMWARQTLLEDNKALIRQVKDLQRENKELTAYIRGLERGVRVGRRAAGDR